MIIIKSDLKLFLKNITNSIGSGSCRQTNPTTLSCSQSEESFVEGPGEEDIQQVVMDEAQAQDTPTETEPAHAQTHKSERDSNHPIWKSLHLCVCINSIYTAHFIHSMCST